MSSHSIPLPLPASFPPLYGARYSETTANSATVTTYGGLVAMEDCHDDDPESILDEHVQRVMKTPGCQSPGATNSTLGGGGRHTPPKSSRSPDGGTGPPHYPPHRGAGHSLPAAGVKGEMLRREGGGVLELNLGVGTVPNAALLCARHASPQATISPQRKRGAGGGGVPGPAQLHVERRARKEPQLRRLCWRGPAGGRGLQVGGGLSGTVCSHSHLL